MPSGILSIDAGSRMLNIVEGIKSGRRGVTIRHAYSHTMHEECMENGVITNREAFTAQLKEAIAKGGFKATKAVLTISNAAAIVRDTSLPGARKNVLESMVRNEMQEVFQDETFRVIQYRRIGTNGTDNGEKSMRLRMAAIPFEVVSSYWEALNEAGLTPLAMDVNANSSDKLLSGNISINGIQALGRGSYIAMDFGYANTDIYFFTDSQTELMRQIPMGLRDLYNAISNENALAGINGALKFPEGLDSIPKEAEPFLEQWLDEIVKVVQYYRSLRRGKIIKRMFLYGGGAMIHGLPEYLTRMFDVPCEILRKIDRVKDDGALGEHGLAVCLNAIGAIIRL